MNRFAGRSCAHTLVVAAVVALTWLTPIATAEDVEVRDVYSVGKDEPVAYVGGEPLFWSDFARFMVRRMGANIAHGHFDQLIYTAVLRQQLAARGLKVHQSDIDAELSRAHTNSVAGDPRMRSAVEMEDFLNRIKAQLGHSRESYKCFNWGFAAQSVLVDAIYPEAERRRLYESGEHQSGRRRYMASHILAQTVGGKRSPEEARQRIEAAAARLAAGEDWNRVAWETSDDFSSLSKNAANPRGFDVPEGLSFVSGVLTELVPGQCPYGEKMIEELASLDQPGEVTSIFESPFGLHIAMLISVKPPTPYEENASRMLGFLSGQLMARWKAISIQDSYILMDRDWVLEPYHHQDLPVARVGDEELMLSDFGRLMYLNNSPRDGGGLVRLMMEEYALVLAARERSLIVSDEQLEAALEADLQKSIAEGMVSASCTVPEWLAQRSSGSYSCPRQLRSQKRFDLYMELARDALSDEEAIATYYRAHPGEFSDKFRTRSVRVVYFGGKRSVEEARQIAEDVYTRLTRAREALDASRRGKEDEDYFAILAEQWSDHPPTRSRGGVDNPWRRGVDQRGGTSGMGYEFEEAVAAAGLGSAGVATIPGGFAIFEVLDHEPPQTLEDSVDLIRKQLRTRAGASELQWRKGQAVELLLGLPR